MTTISKRAAVLCTSLIVFAFGAACDVHEGNFDEDTEFSAGGADPYNFPPPYRGTGALRQTAASGVFTEVGAFAKGKPVGYFSFPFSPSQIATTSYAAPSMTAWPEGVIDPLRISGPGTDFRQSLNNPVPVPLVYNFDPPNTADPFAAKAKCTAPGGANYKYDAFREAFPSDVQWNVFTFLPDRFTSFPFGALPTWSYRPIVAEVSVNTKDLACQAVKSERTLLSQADASKVDMIRGEPESDKKIGRLGRPNPDKFLAWALIDPGAAVVRVGERPDVLSGGSVSGTSVQKYGWYGQFIVAYIDGGYIPVEDGPKVAGAATKRIRTQRLYYPRTDVIRTGATSPTPGALGQGYDVLQASRFGADGVADPSQPYSPVCELWTYALAAATAQKDLPQDEAAILAVANSSLEPARTPQSATAFTPSAAIIPRYVFCLQAAAR